MKRFLLLTSILVLFNAQSALASVEVQDKVNSVLTSRLANNVTLNTGDKIYNNRVYYEVDTKINLVEHTINILPRYVTEYNRIKGLFK